MICSRPRLRLVAAALVAAIAGSATALPAQIADSDPAGAGSASPAPTAQLPLRPFGVVHPAYVPSQPAPDEEAASDSSSETQPVKRVAAHKRKSVAAESAPIVSRDDPAAAAEPPTPAETLLALSVPASPAKTNRTQPAAPTAVTLTRDDQLRLLAAAAGGALVLAGAGFAIGRRSGRRAQLRGVVAKTPSWLAVMPTDLTTIADQPVPEPNEAPDERADKRVKRGQPANRAGPFAAKRNTA